MIGHIKTSQAIYAISTFLLLAFTVVGFAQVDFEMTLDSTTIEENATFRFYFEHDYGANNFGIMRVLIGDNRDDPEALIINIRGSNGFIEIGENGDRGGFLGGAFAGDETIVSGRRVSVNFALADLRLWTPNQYLLVINLNFRNKDFEGLKRVFMDARDLQGTWAGIRQVATITIEQHTRLSSRHRPQIVSLDPFLENRPDGSRVKYNLNVKDRDGRDDLRTAMFEMSHTKSRGIFGTDRYTVNYINVVINFEDNTFTVYDLEQGYYNRETMTIGASGRIRLRGATVDVHYILPEILEPDTTYAVNMEFTFTNRWAGNYELRANARDYGGNFSGNRGLGNLEVEGGTEAPLPAGISPDNVNLNYRGAPGDRIPLRMSSFWRDYDGTDDIKIVDIKFARDQGDNDDIFFIRVYPNDNKRYIGDRAINFDNTAGRTSSGDWWNDNGYFHNFHDSDFGVSQVNDQLLRVNFTVEFKEAFMGKWNIYMRAMDYAENKTDWQQMGSIDVDYEGQNPRPLRRSLKFDLGIISSQFEFKDKDGPNDIELIEFIVTKTQPQDTRNRVATLIYNHRDETFTINSDGTTNTVNNVSSRRSTTRQQGFIRLYYPQTRMVGLAKDTMYFFLCGQLTSDVPDGLFLVYARTTNTRGITSRWVLLSTYLHDSDTPYFRP